MKFQTIILIAIVVLGFSLRFIDVTNDPPGLYIDEASIGYNAYLILKTGKDEFGVPHPLFFRSFGDYKLPLYVYTVAGSMAIFGKTELGVRMPSILAGTFTVLVLYFFLKKLLDLEQNKELVKKLKYLPLLASFLLVISTWHIQFSRGGFEVTLGTFLYLLGWYLFLIYKEKQTKFAIILSLLLFVAALYTYDSFRILSPLALLFIGFNLKAYKKPKAIPLTVLIILFILPVSLFSLTPGGSQRFLKTSSFAQLGNLNLEHKAVIYPLNYLSNYLSFYSLDFYFDFGDGIGRHQIPNFGELYRWQLLFFLGGIYILLKQKKSIIKNATLLLFFSTPLAGSVAEPSPHALRSLPLVIPCMIFISVGLLFFFQKLSRTKIAILFIVIVVALFEFCFYLHFYYIHYSKTNLLDWGAGYPQLIVETEKIKGKYKHIVIDNNLPFAPVYYHYYDNSIQFIVAQADWRKPKTWGNEPTLYIRPYYGNPSGKGLVENIYLTNLNHDIYAQLWEIK